MGAESKTPQIEKDFLRQISNLQTYMNAYSFTLRMKILTDEEYEKLYYTLVKYANIASTRFHGI